MNYHLATNHAVCVNNNLHTFEYQAVVLLSVVNLPILYSAEMCSNFTIHFFTNYTVFI